MASSTTQSKPAPKRTARKSNGSKAAPKKATGKPKPKASTTPRPQYDDNVKAITEKARGYACPESRQGPVARQVQQVQETLGDPRAALKEAGVTRKALKAYAQGSGDKDVRAALRPLGQRVVAAGGAKQWVSGRPLAATLVAWLEQK